MMSIKKGDTVRVHYTGTLTDGTVFDSSNARDPIEFVFGSGTLIEGFEKALCRCCAGERLHIIIPALEAYGDVDEQLIFTVPLREIPPHITPEVGLQLSLSTAEGDMDMIITHVNNDQVVLDANHPLAGKELTFDIEIISIN